MTLESKLERRGLGAAAGQAAASASATASTARGSNPRYTG
jgi:hypothetical protein